MAQQEALLAENIYKLLSGELPIGAAIDTSVDAQLNRSPSPSSRSSPVELTYFVVEVQVKESRYICHRKFSESFN